MFIREQRDYAFSREGAIAQLRQAPLARTIQAARIGRRRQRSVVGLLLVVSALENLILDWPMDFILIMSRRMSKMSCFSSDQARIPTDLVVCKKCSRPPSLRGPA